MLGFGAQGRLALGEIPSSAATALTADVGSYVITWQTVAFAPSIPVATGSYVLTGQTTTGLRVSVPITTGAFVITGQPVSMTTGITLVASPQQSGARVQFSFGALGEFAIGQLAATSPTTYVLAFQAVSARFGLPVATGSYIITGQPVTLFLGNILTAQPGSYILSPKTVLFQVNMPVTKGTYLLTGQRMDFTRPIVKFRAFNRAGHGTVSAKTTGPGMRAKVYGG
jgi:hypothetical protein